MATKTEPKKPRILLLRTFTSTDDYYGGCEWAAVEITDELRETILLRHAAFLEAKKNDSSLYRVEFWSYVTTYYEGGTDRLGDELQDVLLEGEVLDKPDDFELPKEDARTECDMMRITEDGVSWSANPKHSGTEITTPYVSIEVIKGSK